jgi:cation:H+ antiporter
VSRNNTKAWWGIALGFVFGQLMLIAGAFVLVENGEKLAHLLGLSETVIGFTVIAVGTSLPELVTAITSIRRKSGGLAVGNVIGANIINCTLLLGVCGIIGDIKGNSLPMSRETVFIALPVLFVLTAVAVLPLLVRGRAFRWQGVLLLVLYAAYISYLMIVQPI